MRLPVALACLVFLSSCSVDVAEEKAEQAEKQSTKNDTKITAVDDDVKGLSHRVARLEALLGTNASDVTEATTRISELEAEVANLQSTNNELASLLSFFQIETMRLYDKALTFSSDIGTLQGKVSGLETNVGTLSSNTSTLLSNSAVHGVLIADLQQEVIQQGVTIETLATDVAALSGTQYYPSNGTTTILRKYAVSATGVVLGPVLNQVVFGGESFASFYFKPLDAILTIRMGMGLLDRFAGARDKRLFYTDNACSSATRYVLFQSTIPESGTLGFDSFAADIIEVSGNASSGLLPYAVRISKNAQPLLPAPNMYVLNGGCAVGEWASGANIFMPATVIDLNAVFAALPEFPFRIEELPHIPGLDP